MGKDLVWEFARDKRGQKNLYCMICKTPGVSAQIAKYRVQGKFKYVAWRNGKEVGMYESADAAKAKLSEG